MENSIKHITLDEMVFEHRNKEYGAYKLRKNYNKLVSLSTGIALAIFILVLAAPQIYAAINNIIERNRKEIPIDKNIVVQMEDIKPQKEEEVVVEEPPKELEKSIKFTQPEIAKNVNDNEMTTQEELKESQAGKETVTNGLAVGSLVDTNVTKKVDIKVEEKPFLVVEEPPTYPGGPQALYKFIGENIRYPEKALEMEIEGKVYVQFVVGSDGRVKDAKIIRALDADCDKEALRVVMMLPRWTPGRQSGKEVSVYYTLPIQFKIQKK